SVVSQNLKSPAKAFLDLGLQRVVMVVGIVAKVEEGNIPTEFGKIWPALVGRKAVGETDDGRRILIVIGAAIKRHMGTLIADVASLDRNGAGELMLDGRIPRVH